MRAPQRKRSIAFSTNWVPPHGHAADPCNKCGQIHHRGEDGKYRPCFT